MEAVSADKHQLHKEKIKQVFGEVAKVVVGQEYMVNRLLIGLFTNGHILLEGVPGLGEDPYRKYPGPCAAPGFSAHSIYTRFVTCRFSRYDDLQSEGWKV
jgi:hypothetical protein